MKPTTSIIFYFKPKCHHETTIGHMRFSEGSFREVSSKLNQRARTGIANWKEKQECHKTVLYQLDPREGYDGAPDHLGTSAY